MPPTNQSSQLEELAFAGAVLDDPEWIDEFDLPVEALIDNAAATVYGVALRLYGAGKKVNYQAVVGEIVRDGIAFEEANNIVKRCDEERAMTLADFRGHASTIARGYRLRRLLEMSESVKRAASGKSADPEEIFSQVERDLSSIRTSHRSSDFEWMSDTIDRVGSSVINKVQGPEKVIETRVAGLNRIIVGFEPGDYVVVASPPSYGKTAFASDCCYFSSRLGVKSLYFNFDQTNESLARRVLMAHSGFSKGQLLQKTSPLSDYHKGKLSEAITEAKSARGGVLQADSRMSDIASIERVARRAHRQYGIGLMVIDYIQQVKWTGRPIGRTNEVTEISGRIKALGIELDIPIIVVSQLSREYDKEPMRAKEGKYPRPRLSMLRDSGAIEQDANIVLFIHSLLKATEMRHGTDSEYYQSALKRWKHGVCIDCEIIVAKNKDGETGTANCQFNTEKLNFSTPDNYHTEGPML